MLIYFLKFIASFLLPPGIIILFLGLLSVLLFRQNNRFAKHLGIVTIIFYLLSTGYFGNLLLRPLESRFSPPPEVTGDVIVMLGGGATLDTPDVSGVGNLSGSAANRLLTVVRLYKKLGVPVIVSGGQVFEDTGREAVIARRILLDLGVPDDKIIVEDASLNTKQNAEYVGKLLENNNFKDPILVTSAFHMERAVLNFHKQNISVRTFPADYLTSACTGIYFNNFTPSFGGLFNTGLALHEYLGIFAAGMF